MATKTAVLYFSRTGTSERIARMIGDKLNSPVYQLDDHVNYKGIIGYLRGGYYASQNKSVFYDTRLVNQNLPDAKATFNQQDYDQFVVVTPLWAGGAAPAVRALVKDLGGAKSKVHLIVSSMGSKANDRQGYASVTDVVGKDKNEKAVIDQFISKIALN